MIVWDNGTKKQRVYEIWEDNFHDPVSYANFYFNEVYGKNEVLLNEEMSADENLVKGMLHLNPYTLMVNGIEKESYYIVAVATRKEYRGRRYMAGLLREALLDMYQAGVTFTYLMPAAEAIYLPHDFRTLYEQNIEYYAPEDFSLGTERTGEEIPGLR